MAELLSSVIAALRDFGRGALGTGAYEAYLRAHERSGSSEPPLCPHEFHRQKQAAQWEGVRRCC